jgi:hypothetical protein
MNSSGVDYEPMAESSEDESPREGIFPEYLNNY